VTEDLDKKVDICSQEKEKSKEGNVIRGFNKSRLPAVYRRL